MNSNNILLVLGVATILLTSQTSSAENRDLCTSIPRACVYTGPLAPLLRADVCWNGSTAQLKGAQPCPTGAWPYAVSYGDIDPLSGVVHGYVPLDDACSHPGICELGVTPLVTTTEAICCDNDGNCVPISEDPKCGAGTTLLCDDGVSNDDGTVTCFEGNEV